MSKTWRDSARPIIAEVLRETKGQPESVIRRELKEAYPFGERKYHPYKIWLDEIKKQRFGKKRTAKGQLIINPNQTQIF